MARRITREEFIEKARAVHGEEYSYELVDYKNYSTPVKIMCPIHGVFEQTPRNHIQGDRCPSCFRSKKKTKEQFVQEAKAVYGEKYNYDKVDYKSNKTPVIITCPVHGDFVMAPLYHLQGHGCLGCYNDRRGDTTRIGKEKFIERAKSVHGEKYDYSKIEYVNNETKVHVICPKHGDFWITPNKHLNSKQGCRKCAAEANGLKKRISQEEFTERCKSVHGEKYDYSKAVYQGWDIPLTIICPVHGEFKQTAGTHMSGNGCPLCGESHLERDLAKFLDENNISYERQKRFQWLGLQSLDFYLPEYDIAIECQGLQHYSEMRSSDKPYYETLEVNIDRDKKKKDLCNKHNVNIIYFTYDKKIFDVKELYIRENTFLNLSSILYFLKKH